MTMPLELDRSGRFYIGGKWVVPSGPTRIDVTNPATEEIIATVAGADRTDVDLAVTAARTAFGEFQFSSPDERRAIIERIRTVFVRNQEEMARTIAAELGCPIDKSRAEQTEMGVVHIDDFLARLPNYPFEEPFEEGAFIRREPVGVCVLITPWNWPINQIALKVIPALAAGCCVVLKPSEETPLNALLFARILDEAGVPPGVFNLINGTGPDTGAALIAHPEIDLISLTGSTDAGRHAAKAGAEGIKRVALELGGKSPNVIFAGCDLELAISEGVFGCFDNSGQSCDAPTRMLVEASIYDEAVELARKKVEAVKLDDPFLSGDHLGPLVSEKQRRRVLDMIRVGIAEGAELVTGGAGDVPEHPRGYYVQPTLFANVTRDMRIFQEEIFGPVLTITRFEEEDQAVELANDSAYGLSGYVQTADPEQAVRVARKLRTGMVRINGADIPDGAPFGGFGLSGIGREGGSFGIDEFCEIKLIARR